MRVYRAWYGVCLIKTLRSDWLGLFLDFKEPIVVLRMLKFITLILRDFLICLIWVDQLLAVFNVFVIEIL